MLVKVAVVVVVGGGGSDGGGGGFTSSRPLPDQRRALCVSNLTTPAAVTNILRIAGAWRVACDKLPFRKLSSLTEF